MLRIRNFVESAEVCQKKVLIDAIYFVWLFGFINRFILLLIFLSCHFYVASFLGHRLTWGAYHRTADIFSFLDYLVATYPDLCSLRTIGLSVEKRPLKVLKCVILMSYLHVQN